MKIEINDDTVKKLQKRAETSKEFKDVEEYINYVLKQVVEKIEQKKEKKEKDSEKDSDDKESYSKDDEEKIKQRLKSLGYM